MVQYASTGYLFQSTLPLRGVTSASTTTHATTSFQSTLPLRGVTAPGKPLDEPMTFQSTLPLRGVTVDDQARLHVQRISIHTPLAGSDDIGYWSRLLFS